LSYIGQRPVVGRYIKLDQISSGFNGSNTGFSMTAGSQAVFPGTARNLLLSLGGVIQEPDTDFTISGSTLTFTTPPVANTTFFGVIYGDMQATGTPSDGTVLPASIASSGHFKIPQLTVNEDGADVDFRVEGDTDANLLFVNAGTDRIGIGTNAPTSPLEISHATNPVIKVTSTSSSVGAAFTAQGGSSNDSQLVLSSGTTAKYTFLRDGSQSDDLRIYDSSNALDIIRYRHGAYLHFGVNGSERMRINSSGNVGIGTSSPGEKLEVSGEIKLTNFLKAAGDLLLCADHDNSLSGSALRFCVDGEASAEKMRIDDSGKVGIGTTSPIEILHADGAIISVGSSSTSGTTGAKRALFDLSGNQCRLGHFRGAVSAGSGSIGLYTESTEKVRIDTSGKVGIGETTLDALLVIKGNSDASTTPSIRLKDGSDTREAWITNTAGDLLLATGGDDNTPHCKLTLMDGNIIHFSTANTERMRIDSLGNVLVGASSSIEVASSAEAQLQITQASDGSRLGLALISVFNGSGPSAILALGHGRGSTSGALQDNDLIGQIRFAGGDGTDCQTIGADIRAEVNGTPSSNNMPADLIFLTNSGTASVSERMRITKAGNVGIGMASATFSSGNGLQLADNFFLGFGTGNGTRPDFQFGTTAGSTLDIRCGTGADTVDIVINTSGFLGLGTTSPSRKLHVDSSFIRVSDGYGLDTGGSTERVTLDSGFVSLTTNSVERLRVTSGGDLVLNSTTSRVYNGHTPKLSIQGTNFSQSTLAITSNSNGTDGAYLFFVKQRSGSVGGSTAPSNGDLVGQFRYLAGDGTDTQSEVANISVNIDGAPGSNDTPGRITFATTNDGGNASTERMRITSAGHVHIGNGHGNANHRINGNGFTQGQTFLVVSAYSSSAQDTAIFFGVDSGGGNTASCGLKLGRNSSNLRSLNAGGTLNASGTDYAEYMTKSSDFTLAKGAICGINAEGKLTNKFSESISFVVKSTDPSYVGGDTWGSEDILGKKPKDKSSELPAYEEKMEAARKMVDRIAFSGQVPVNVTGTTPGQHIIPTLGTDDSITGVAKAEASLSMAEYISSVGKVIALESDGRARIIVKVA